MGILEWFRPKDETPAPPPKGAPTCEGCGRPMTVYHVDGTGVMLCTTCRQARQ